MSKRLLDRIKEMLIKKGDVGKAMLGDSVNRSPQTIGRWLVKGIPTATDAYKLAKACGCTDEEALSLARECFPDGATDQAS